MGDKTGIQWADATWNPIVGCSLVSPGCTNCYAMTDAGNRLGHNPKTPQYAGLTLETKAGPVWNGKVAFVEKALTKPLRWKRLRRIFVNSMGDLFHESVPDEWIDRVFAVMALAPQHTFQVLTKRSKRMLEYCSAEETPARIAESAILVANDAARLGIFKARAQAMNAGVDMHAKPFIRWPLPNVWKGVSAEDQPRADERIPDLLATPGAVRFVSAEPLLGPIDFGPLVRKALISGNISGVGGDGTKPIGWIIVGGESGRDPRDNGFIENARAILAQCKGAGIPFFGKQNVGKAALPDDLMVREFP